MTELNLIGRTIGRFDVLEELGRGGMAVVYKARQKSPNRIVALKVLPPEMSFNKDYIARFHQEADSVAALEHPHIVPIYAVDEDQGLHYIAMKFIQGRTLKEVAQEEGALSVERAVELVGQVADALDYAHSQNVIHRDIKPSNMMVTDNGWVYLTDFGLARGTGGNAGLTATGTVMGTPEYMSPEQAQGLPTIGPATDIYALGVVLYELLTGQFPFQADTPMAMLAARLIHPPRPPREYRGELPLAVEDVIMRALARKPQARYPTAGALIADLRKASGTAPQQPQRPMTPSDGLTVPVANPTPTPVPQQIAYRPAPVSQPQPQPTPVPQPPQQTPSWPQQVSQVPQQTPSWPQPPVQPTRKGGLGSGILIGIGATVLVLVLACVGIGVWASTLPSADTTPTPQVSLRATAAPKPTAQPKATPVVPTEEPAIDPALAAQIEEGDKALEGADFAAAAAAYQKALDTQANSAEALARLALVNDFAAHYDEIVDFSNKAVEAAGDDKAQAAVAHALLSDGLVYTSQFDSAVEAANTAAELDGTQGIAQAAKANAVARLASERWESSKAGEIRPLIEAARSELKDDPKVFQALTYSLIGDTYMSLHDLSGDDSDVKAAKDAYKEALDLSDQPLFHAGLGFAYNRNGEYGDARESFNKALEQDATFVQAQVGLGWSDFNDPDIKDFVPALAAFDKALTIKSDDPAALFGRGRSLFAQKKYPEATDAFRQSVTARAESLNLAWLGRSLQREGYDAPKMEDADRLYNESADAFLRALTMNDRQVVAWTYLGWTRQYQEKYEESVDAFHKALEIDELEEESHNGLAWSLYNMGKYDEAETSFRRAIELDSEYANAHYGLGLTLEKLGKIDDAKQAYRDTLKLDPEYKDAQDALDKLPK